MDLKKYLVFAGLTLAQLTAAAAVSEGNFNYQGSSYYSNGTGAYCQRSQYHQEYRRLDYREAQELRYTRFDGRCADGWAEGGLNFRGRSYYANTTGQYCSYRWYNQNLREIGQEEARELFRKQYDGECRVQ